MVAAVVNAPPEELAPRLARKSGPIQRGIRRSDKAVVKAQNAIDRDRPPKKVGRKINKLRRSLDRLATRVDALPGGISVGLRQLILDNAQGASEAISTD
jgi:hypothetical protein